MERVYRLMRLILSPFDRFEATAGWNNKDTQGAVLALVMICLLIALGWSLFT